MTGNWSMLLLSHRSACLRHLALTRLLDLPDDNAEVKEVAALREQDDLVVRTRDLQRPDGSWDNNATAWTLLRFSVLGIGGSWPEVHSAAEYLFSQQREDGSWPIPRSSEAENVGYDMIPLQTALPLIGLAATGYAADPRSERGYAWLLKQRLEDGSWPTGVAGGTYGKVAGYRRLPHSRWGCRTNTTAALMALAYHPERRRDSAAMRALELLLERESRERRTLGFEVARTLGYEPVSGFFTRFARFDPGFILDLASKVGASRDDERIADLVDWILSVQGPLGLWEYLPHPAASHWVTYGLLISLRELEANGQNGIADALWTGAEPRTPFQPYPHAPKRH